MQINITLSKKEKRHYFLYLLAMLTGAVLILSIIVLNKAINPFSEADMHSVMILQEKNKFNEAQKVIQSNMDSTFVKIDKYDAEKANPVQEHNINEGISNVQAAFKMSGATDPRKESYPQISKFYRMYMDDKKSSAIIKGNIESFSRQYEDCTVGFRDRQQMMQR